MGTFLASICAPLVNTVLFVLLCLTLSGALNASGFIADGQSVVYFLIIVCAGVNFLVELAVNLVVAPALFRVVGVLDRTIFDK